MQVSDDEGDQTSVTHKVNTWSTCGGQTGYRGRTQELGLVTLEGDDLAV